ncbi:MAG: DinB family protein [Chloroflexota bacterium]
MINPPPPAELVSELDQFRNYVAHLDQDTSLDWHTQPAPEEWSLGEVLCHLRDVEREVHQARIKAVLAEEQAFLAGVDADQWAEPRSYKTQDGPTALAEYLAARDETIRLLRTLSPEDWERQGQHTFFGPTTLQELVNLVVQHDRVHEKQIDALLHHDSGEATE